MKHQVDADQDLPPQGANKWEVLRELAAARTVYGLSDRDISVLQTLVSFHPATVLGGNDAELVVHPSNRAICERLNGMPCSTMRRHLAHLVEAGVILRRDSPNGKRYARRVEGEKIAFGFDLSPLVRRFSEFCQAAEAVREAADRYKRLRETVSLMRRDLIGITEYGAEARPEAGFWDQFLDLATHATRELRRKLPMSELEALKADLQRALDAARDILEPVPAEDMSTNGVLDEHHIQSSKTDSHDLEPCFEKAGGGVRTSDLKVEEEVDESMKDLEDITDQDPEGRLPNIPIGLVLANCPEIRTYAGGAIRHWHELVAAAETVRPMMGISPSAWLDARREMGPEEAAIVVAAMLERFSEIKSPGGYLRSLTAKAAEGRFSCGPMVMALMRRDAA